MEAGSLAAKRAPALSAAIAAVRAFLSRYGLILVLLVRPSGILGKATVEKV